MSKPILIYEGGGSNPHIIGIIDTGKYADHDSKAMSAIINKRVNNISTLEVVIPANCTASRTITYTSDLVVYDTDGKIQEFHITDLEDVEEYSVERIIYAEQTLGELINDIILGTTAMPTTKNPADYLGYILSFTRWTVGTVDSSIYNSQWRQDLVGLNCLQALQLFIEKYDCEFEPRYVTDNKNKIIGRYLDIKKTIGHNYGKRFEDDKDITKIKRNLNLDAIKTAIYPRIARNTTNEAGESITEYVDISSVGWSVANGDPVDKPLGQAILVNKDIDDLYKRYNTKTGKLMDRIMYAEWTEDTAEDAESLCRQAWAILRMNGVLTPSFEIDASDLYRMSGNNEDYQHERVALGDTCIIIAKQFNPAIRVTTRVMEMEEDLLNPINNKFVFGKYRRTLATSNLDQQNSVEQKLNGLQNQLQNIKLPEYDIPFQSGRIPYEQVKEQIQNGFISANGYVMAEDSDGFWVFDKPTGEQPTKAIILKGGCLGIASYNTITSSWEVGTFIDGTSVNADYINSGHINTDLLAAGSINAEHLSVAAQEYLKTGLATENDLQDVIDSVAENYPTKTSVVNQINTAISEGVSEVEMTTRVKSLQEFQRQLKIEYTSTKARADKIYADTYLPAGSTAKTGLDTAISNYITSYNTYYNQISTMLSDDNITDDEYNAFVTNSDDYSVKFKELAEAMEIANNARLANVYAQARQGLVTTAELEVNNQSVIASAKAGMVSTGDMTSAISLATQDLVSTSALNTAINGVQSNVDNMQIGGRNLLPRNSLALYKATGSFDSDTNTWTITASTGSSLSGLTIVSGKHNIIFSYGQGVVYSFEIKVPKEISLKFDFNNAPVSGSAWNGNDNDKGSARIGLVSAISKTDEWVHCWVYCENTNTSNTNKVDLRDTSSHVGIPTTIQTEPITFYIRNVKVELGNKATAFSPCPEDVYAENIHEVYNSIKAEYNNNYKLATTLYANSYLAGDAKLYLKYAYEGYATRFNALTTAHNNIYPSANVTEATKIAWNTAIATIQEYITTFALRVQEAQTYINTAVYNASKTYTDNAIPDALTGYAKTTYVDTAKQQAITDAKAGMVSTSQLQVNNTEILMATAKMGQYNLLRNTDFRDGTNFWTKWHNNNNEAGITSLNFSILENNTWCMSGEKTLYINTSKATESGYYGGCIYQDVYDVNPNTTYTLSQWTACHRSTVVISIKEFRTDGTNSTIASKHITSPKSGGVNRAYWDYSSITFTTSATMDKIRVMYQLYNVTANANHGSNIYVVKPMLCTGINAQPWSAHPDEIHIGVVSVTEEKGIMVEHSDTDSYTTLDSKGLKVWQRTGSSTSTLMASFGENNLAYINKVSCEVLNAPNIMYASKLGIGYIYIYISQNGSGDYSGSDSSNCARGWTNGMRIAMEKIGLPFTNGIGNFILSSGKIIFYIKGNFYDDINLYNINGAGEIEINFDTVVYYGKITLKNITAKIIIRGNRSNNSTKDGTIFARTSCDNFYIEDCTKVILDAFRINNPSGTSNVTIMDIRNYSNVHIYNIDVYSPNNNFISNMGNSTVTIENSRGTVSGTIKASNGWSYLKGNIPNGTTIINGFDGSSSITKTASLMSSYSSGSTLAVTTELIPDRIYSANSNNTQFWGGALIQNTELTGFADFNNMSSKLSGASGVTMRIYLKRELSVVNTGTVNVKINDNSLGTLANGASGWFTIPSAIVTKLQNGTLTTLYFSCSSESDVCTYSDISLRITATKTF